MTRNREGDWILIAAVAFFTVRILPWLLIGGAVLWWLVSHVRFV